MDNNQGLQVICSDDPLLKMEYSQNVISAWRQQAPDAEYRIYTFSELQGLGSGGANLKELENELSDVGLLGGAKIIKIILKDLDATAMDLFEMIAATFHSDLYILIEMPRINTVLAKAEPQPLPEEKRHRMSFRDLALDSDDSKSSGRKKSTPRKAKGGKSGSGDARKKAVMGYLKYLGAHIEVLYTPEGQDLRHWIDNRAHEYNFSLTKESIEFIANCYDNNLLGIDQCLQIMDLMYCANPSANRFNLGVKEVEPYFSQDARFSGFELPNAILTGDSLRALNVISSYSSGQGGSISAALSLFLFNLDAVFTAVYDGKTDGITAKTPYGERSRFFLSHGIKTPAAQNAIMAAIKDISTDLLDVLNNCLTEATLAYSRFDNDGAYRALQRMAVLVTKNKNQQQTMRLAKGLAFDLLQ